MAASNLSDKVVVITGVNSGIGEATARLLAGRGAKVVLGATRKDDVDALVRNIRAAGGSAIGAATDVAKREDVAALVGCALRAHGRVDVLVNNAGSAAMGPMAALDVLNWERTIDVNLKGVLYGVAAVLPIMKWQKSGHIVNIASEAGCKVLAGGALYSATKFAVRALTEGLRLELRADGIRCTTISPGAVAAESASPAAAWESLRDAQWLANPAASIAAAIAHAVGQPRDAASDEIVVPVHPRRCSDLESERREPVPSRRGPTAARAREGCRLPALPDRRARA